MITVLIYLKGNKKPFQIEFESKKMLNDFYDDLALSAIQIITIGPLTFAKTEFRYCLQK